MATRRRLGGKILTKRAVSFEGIPELVKRANQLMRDCGYNGGEIAAELKHGLMAGALIIRDEARDLVPVDTGRLRRSIFAAYGNKKKADVLVGVNTRMAVREDRADKRTYAGIIEFGDDTHHPQPFMRPAVQATRPTVATIVAEKLRFAIEKLASK